MSGKVTIRVTKNSKTVWVKSVAITYEKCTQYAITTESKPQAGGEIKASSSSSCEGNTITLSCTKENNGYYFSEWTVYDDDLNEYTVTDNAFTMPAAAVTVEGTFVACTTLSAPTNAEASSVTTTSATLTWAAVENATSYSIELSNGKTYPSTTTSLPLTSLTPGTDYIASITAVGDNHHYCSSAETADVEFTTVSTYSVNLSTPTGGTIKSDKATAAAGETITLSYTEANGYHFTSWTVLNEETTDAIPVTDNAFTMPAAAVEVSAEFTACTKLSTPQDLKVSDITTTSATLSFSAVEHAKEYTILVGDAESLTTSETTVSLTGLSPETKYEILISAVADGHIYCESGNAESSFTTTALPKYKITWVSPTTTEATLVTQGEKVVLPTTTPRSCSDTYTQFVGWFTEQAGTDAAPYSSKPATQVTSATVPTADATYYAVFCDGKGVTLWAETFAHFANGATTSTAGTGTGTTIYGSATITYSQNNKNTIAYSAKLAGGTSPELLLSNSSTWTISGIPTNSAAQMELSFLSNQTTFELSSTTEGISFSGSGTAWTIKNSSNVATFDLTLKNTSTSKNARIDNVSLVVSSQYISSCCSDPAVVTVTPAATELNLGEDGTATTTASCTQTGGGADGTWSYSVKPATATFDGTTFTATAAGEYTLYATYTESCGKIGLATVKVTKNPIFGTATIDKSDFALSCGDTTSMNSASTISFGTNYNLTKSVTVTAPEGFLVSTNKTEKTKYAASVTLEPTKSGGNTGKITGNVYVRAYSAIARAEGYSGEVTISGDEITTQTLTVSSAVTCKTYPLTLSDRGTTTVAGNYYAGAEVPKPADPTGVCTEPYAYQFAGWSAASVADDSRSYTEATFPYTMPGAPATLYAVYTYTVESSVFYTSTPCACEDVPTDLSATATASSVTISWTCQSPTATVELYPDLESLYSSLTSDNFSPSSSPAFDASTLTTSLTSDNSDLTSSLTSSPASDNSRTTPEATPSSNSSLTEAKTNATSPCQFTGLTPKTKYYYRVLSAGSCSSAVASFSTESTEVSVVEWKKDAVVVDLNTEGDDVRVIIEGQTSHGDKSKNIADDLFFSKYYEATANVKLLGIYNGTLDTLSLEKIQVNIGKTDYWHYQIPMSSYGRKKTGYIAPNEEIILWYSPELNTDSKITKCVKEKGYVDFTLMESNNFISFAGDQTITLSRDATLIDVLGAVTSDGSPKQANITPAWGDGSGWLGRGYNIENQMEEIDLSTNRCLLVRSNQVKSGANAVAQNIGAFNTFTKEEWLGRQVSKLAEDGTNDNGVESSCNGFAFVADFNYNDYYVSYDSITSMDIQGKQNPDGSYTIPIDRLDTMACTNMRIEVKQNGVVVATKDQRVPIVVTVNSDTDDDVFTNERLSEEICKTCDVVVRDKAMLAHISGGVSQFRDMYVYAGAKLEIPATESFTLSTAHVHGLNDTVAYAIINNGGTISIDRLVHVKRIDGKYWYPFSLPYDCRIADICQLSGLGLGRFGVDWGIKYYDGEKRQKDGNSTTTFGEVSKYWTMMPADGTLKANTGYIIGLFSDNEELMRSVYFTPAGASNYTENEDSKTTQVTAWPHNLTAEARHHGWNFVGSPYISLFGSGSGNEGIFNSSLKMGYTMRDGTQADKEHVYVSIPDGGNKNTYTQALASATTLKPFTPYFVQAIDPTDSESHTYDLTYSKSNRSLPTRKPAAVTLDEPILVELTLAGTNSTESDNAGVWMSNRYSNAYEIGDDLYKMYAEGSKPQLYTTDSAGLRMAYLAVPDQASIPVGLYLPAAGNYTLSLNGAVSRVGAAQAVYLQHNGTVVADLMSDAYAITATQRGTVSGYSLSIRRAPHTTTATESADGVRAVCQDGRIVVSHLSAGATVRIYDMLGHLCYTATATDSAIEMPTSVRGVYTIVVADQNAQTILKTLAY